MYLPVFCISACLSYFDQITKLSACSFTFFYRTGYIDSRERIGNAPSQVRPASIFKKNFSLQSRKSPPRLASQLLDKQFSP